MQENGVLMGLSIHTTGICDNPEEYSSVKLAAIAGDTCISKSGIDKKDLDLLINIGIFRDKNIMEPAMASLIQREIRLNNDPIETFDKHTTFSLDMVNGVTSFINAVELIDSMAKNGESNYAIIVAGDTHPSQTWHPNFPFRNFGGAMMLSKNSDNELGQYFYNTSGNGYTGLKGFTRAQLGGQKALDLEFDDDYHEKLMAFTIESVKKAVNEKKLDLSDVKAVICSQPFKDFGKSVTKEIGLKDDLSIDTYDQYGDTYSSALILGYNEGIEQDLIKKGDKVLFIATGSGLSMGCCVM
jgi:3-oxoacyl-[acyl-carrier-protein] synthase-3